MARVTEGGDVTGSRRASGADDPDGPAGGTDTGGARDARAASGGDSPGGTTDGGATEGGATEGGRDGGGVAGADAPDGGDAVEGAGVRESGGPAGGNGVTGGDSTEGERAAGSGRAAVGGAAAPGGVTGGGRSPGRAGLGMRDLVGALAVLLVIVGVLVATTRGCSFDPGAPSAGQAPVPSVDVSAKLSQAASAVAFPVRQPALPRSWRPNSSSNSAAGSGSTADVVVRVGWLTAGGRYMQLSQSGAAVGDVVAAETGGASARTGTVSVAGVSWDTYPSRRDEAAWVASLDGAVVLVTGDGTDAEFRELASAVVAAKPLG